MCQLEVMWVWDVTMGELAIIELWKGCRPSLRRSLRRVVSFQWMVCSRVEGNGDGIAKRLVVFLEVVQVGDVLCDSGVVVVVRVPVVVGESLFCRGAVGARLGMCLEHWKGVFWTRNFDRVHVYRWDVGRGTCAGGV